jgi:hypothetical protein
MKHFSNPYRYLIYPSQCLTSENLTCDELIMKFVRHLFIVGSYILHMNIMCRKHVWHIDKCVDGWSMNLWMNECCTKFQFHVNPCVKCVFNAWYQCMKHTNYEWTNFAWFSLLHHEMLYLWWNATLKSILYDFDPTTICIILTSHTILVPR